MLTAVVTVNVHSVEEPETDKETEALYDKGKELADGMAFLLHQRYGSRGMKYTPGFEITTRVE